MGLAQCGLQLLAYATSAAQVGLGSIDLLIPKIWGSEPGQCTLGGQIIKVLGIERLNPFCLLVADYYIWRY